MTLTPFSWYGGKTSHLKWLLPIINQTPHLNYVESFGGSAAVLLNKDPSGIEVYNDRYGEVVNFFRVLRNRKDELIPLLELTPYSREEFSTSLDPGNADDLERARRFFVRARQVRTGLATTATPGRWAYVNKDSRRGMALVVSRWLSAVEGLEDVCQRLREVQIENLDAIDVIKRYDSIDTLHYIDPPYLMSTRSGGVGYAHEFDESRHIELIEVLRVVQGKIVLSGYENDLYRDRLTGWCRYKAERKQSGSCRGSTGDRTRQEVIWTNYQIPESCNLKAG